MPSNITVENFLNFHYKYGRELGAESVDTMGIDVLEVYAVFSCNINLFEPSKGSTIYGRVMVDPVQNLGDSFICNIEKVFLCTGADGYVPKYNPNNREYGCLAESPTLLHQFKILASNIKHVNLRISCNYNIFKWLH